SERRRRDPARPSLVYGMRGVQIAGTVTTTWALRGLFLDDEVANHGARQTRRTDPPEPEHRAAVWRGWPNGREFQVQNPARRESDGRSRPARNTFSVGVVRILACFSTRFPVTTEKEKTMIFHINRFTHKVGLSEEQRRAGLEQMRQAGASNPAVKSYVVGPELGGEVAYSAVYVVEDLDGYWAYLTHPAHVRSELEGIPLIEKFAAIDVSDSDDPDLGKKIAALQARNFQEHPEVAALAAQAASFTVPSGSGSAD